jgi:hypothetical protein
MFKTYFLLLPRMIILQSFYILIFTQFDYFFEAYQPLLTETLIEFVHLPLFGWYIKLIYPPNIG